MAGFSNCSMFLQKKNHCITVELNMTHELIQHVSSSMKPFCSTPAWASELFVGTTQNIYLINWPNSNMWTTLGGSTVKKGVEVNLKSVKAATDAAKNQEKWR